jgi:two-component system chemotaxis sensor kinase CheA
MSTADYDDSFVADALPAFVSEAHEQIAAIEQLLLQLEDRPADRELLDALFRCAHTVKGSAGIFGLDAVVAFTHSVETLLDRLREGAVVLTPALSTLLLLANDQIRLLVAAAQDDKADTGASQSQREDLVRRLDEAAGCTPAQAPCAQPPAGQVLPAGAVRRWQLGVRFGADTFRNGMDPLAVLGYVGGLGTVHAMRCNTAAVPDLLALDAETCHLAFDFMLETAASREDIEAGFSFVRDDCELSLLEVTPQAVAAPPEADAPRKATPRQEPRGDATAGAAHGEESRYIRVQADRLDDVINLLGELVTAGAGALLLARQSRQGTLVEANQQITSLIEEVRNSTLQLRMVPIGETFSRFRRVVRDTAAELGKDVVLAIEGGDTELDKSVVERIADPLMHLVRNALDHGLETPAQRMAAAKPAQGRLTLSACHESGSILIRIIDDGRGIDRDKVLQRAWERGLVEQGVVPPDADILNLIFEPGFSTADKVTNLSGRGVGMDVVRRNIEALRGSVTLSSQPATGSRIDIRLPLTLAIIDGFLVGVGPSKFIFPLDAVVEVIESALPALPPDARGRNCVELRGQMLPVVDLRTLYALDSPAPLRSSIVVIRSAAQRYGVMVDALLGQHQTVIKPLGRMLRSLRGISGSSILGSGEVALIFDVASLNHLAAQPLEPPGYPHAPRSAVKARVSPSIPH